MAKRPVYIPTSNSYSFVKTLFVDFQWIKGISFAQRQKCLDSFHSAIRSSLHINNILEISTKSRSPIGVQLSAFNLQILSSTRKRCFSVECAFQAGKIFENGGPFKEILNLSSIEAKHFFKNRKDLGRIIAFESKGYRWPTTPTTLFYDWLYINALATHPELTSNLQYVDAFTDIEFNPVKSKNCQAHSLALFCALRKRNLLEKVLHSRESFTELMQSQSDSLSLFL